MAPTYSIECQDIVEGLTDLIELLARDGVTVASVFMNRTSLSHAARSLGWMPPFPVLTEWGVSGPGMAAHLRWTDPRKAVASLTLDLPTGPVRIESADLAERHATLYGAAGAIVGEVALSA